MVNAGAAADTARRAGFTVYQGSDLPRRRDNGVGHMVWVAVFKEQDWVWGILFNLWTLLAIQSGKTFFVEAVDRRTAPILFRLINATWLALGALILLFSLVFAPAPG